MELSRPIIVQHHCHLISTLDLSNLENFVSQEWKVDWHEMKVMWVDRMLHSLCDFQLWPQPWLWPWIFMVKFWKSRISGIWMRWPIDMEWKGCEPMKYWAHVVTFNFDHPWSWPWIFKVKYWNCCISRMGRSTHLEWKGYELDMMLDTQWDCTWVMGQCETLTVSNLLAHEWAIHSLI